MLDRKTLIDHGMIFVPDQEDQIIEVRLSVGRQKDIQNAPGV